MPTFSLPLNILDSAEKILMDAINYENQTSFDYTDFTFGSPDVATLVNTDVNTKIRLTPNVGTLYYNSKEFYYHRMDMGAMYAANPVPVNVGARIFLSELIPEINAFYGINLTADDYVEQALPVEDPMQPDAVLQVALQMQASSILFQGMAMLALNQAPVVIDEDNYDRRTYVLVDSEDTSIFANNITVYNSKFEEDNTYSVLRNCTDITQFNASKLIALSNGNIALRGSFKFTSDISGVAQVYDVKNLITAPNGNLLEIGDDATFGPAAINNYFGHHTDDYKYIIDSGNLVNVSPTTRVYRYDNSGTLDTWDASGIGYIPAVVNTDKLGRVYTFSSPYNDSGWKVRGDRLNVDGTLDNTFTPVIFTITGAGQPLSVAQIKIDKLNQLYVMLRPATSVSSIDPSPIINGVPVIPGGTTQVYGYTPVFRFKENGEWDTSFENKQMNVEPSTIYDIATSNLSVGDRVLSVDGLEINFLTNKRNPITGFLYRTPMAFSKTGKPVRLSGVDYEMQIRWDTAKNMIGLMNGKTIVYGTAMIRNPAGGWQTPTGVVAVYYQNSVTMKVVHNATRAIAGPVLKVLDCVTTELEY